MSVPAARGRSRSPGLSTARCYKLLRGRAGSAAKRYFEYRIIFVWSETACRVYIFGYDMVVLRWRARTVAAGAMDQDDDVERLFSWLQTPEIRYREFAGAREVTDAVVTWQARTNTPQLDPPAPHNVQLDEEYPQDQFPDQSQVRVEVEPAARGPADDRPARRLAAATSRAGDPPSRRPPPRRRGRAAFALGAAGRGRVPLAASSRRRLPRRLGVIRWSRRLRRPHDRRCRAAPAGRRLSR